MERAHAHTLAQRATACPLAGRWASALGRRDAWQAGAWGHSRVRPCGAALARQPRSALGPAPPGFGLRLLEACSAGPRPAFTTGTWPAAPRPSPLIHHWNLACSSTSSYSSAACSQLRSCCMPRSCRPLQAARGWGGVGQMGGVMSRLRRQEKEGWPGGGGTGGAGRGWGQSRIPRARAAAGRAAHAGRHRCARGPAAGVQAAAPCPEGCALPARMRAPRRPPGAHLKLPRCSRKV